MIFLYFFAFLIMIKESLFWSFCVQNLSFTKFFKILFFLYHCFVFLIFSVLVLLIHFCWAFWISDQYGSSLIIQWHFSDSIAVICRLVFWKMIQLCSHGCPLVYFYKLYFILVLYAAAIKSYFIFVKLNSVNTELEELDTLK